MMGRPIAVVPLVALVLVLPACAAAGAGTTAAGRATETSDPAPWQFALGEEKKCDDPAVKDRIARAKALPTETDENGALSTPSEVLKITDSIDEYEAQIDTWEGLSAADRIHNLCLAADQDQGYKR